MKITILTLFPEMYQGFLSTSILKRAIAKGVVSIDVVDIRSYTKDKYGRVDSAPIGGGAGLIMKCQPVIDALKAQKEGKKILFSPRGRTFSQEKAHALSKEEHIILLCGHYEGMDERISSYIDEELSIGDYILTGGELASMVVSDAIIRLLDGAIKEESTIEESFENGLLEYPQYTEPYEYDGKKVPDILYSGNHGAIEKWRKKESLRITKERRPDLFIKFPLTKADMRLLKEIENQEQGKWEIDAINKGKKFMKN